MRLTKHLHLLFVVSAAWFLFWLAGLPDYYRQYSTLTMIIFDAAVLPAIWIAVYSRIKKTRNGKRFAVSLWLSFYVTVPLFFYDWLYCGHYLGRGIGFIWEYWYLTVYYFLPWLVFPLTGWQVERLRSDDFK